MPYRNNNLLLVRFTSPISLRTDISGNSDVLQHFDSPGVNWSISSTPMNKKRKGRDRFVPALPCIARVSYKGSSHSDVGPYVLVEAEEVVGVIATLERL